MVGGFEREVVVADLPLTESDARAAVVPLTEGVIGLEGVVVQAEAEAEVGARDGGVKSRLALRDANLASRKRSGKDVVSSFSASGCRSRANSKLLMSVRVGDKGVAFDTT